MSALITTLRRWLGLAREGERFADCLERALGADTPVTLRAAALERALRARSTNLHPNPTRHH